MTPQQALVRLQQQCSKCEYSTSQIRSRLKIWDLKERGAGRPGFSEDEMEEIISSLQGDRFVDDARFASAYVRDKIRFAKWGPSKISYNLRRLGIDASVIRVALEENLHMIGDGMLEDLMRRKWESLKKDEPLQQKRGKLVKFALGRGFDYNQIMGIIGNFS